MLKDLRVGAAREMRAAFPGELKRYALPRLPETTLSKARLGYMCGPFFRAGLCILALKVGGAPRERAQRLVDWLQDLVDQWWPPVGEPTPDMPELVRTEQEIDGAEDREETDYLLGIPGARTRWLGMLRRRRAHDCTLIQRLEAEEAAERSVAA